MMGQNERLGLLIRILDPEDYQYIRAYDFRIEARFRRERMRIYRGELRNLASDALRSYRTRLSNINAAGRWGAYPGLVMSTASTFSSIGKLWLAGALFQMRLPVMVDVAAHRERLNNFLTAEALSQ
jgi:hypothetical protein